MTKFQVKQDGNHVELHGARETIFYEVQGTTLPPLTDFSFAVWHLLAAAMTQGFDIEIDGPVDSAVIDNARRFSRIWELWAPEKFREVRVTGHEIEPTTDSTRPDLTLFSGGIDSTHMLLKLGKREPASTVLTIQGMDYRTDVNAQFLALLKMTDPLLETLNYDRITLKTNVAIISRGTHSWALTLAGCSFLLSGLFGRASFAADTTWEEDFMIFPWGSNHVTNRLLRGTAFSVTALGEEFRRVEKVADIALNEVALNSISFCKNRAMRPRNCGKCDKCLRNKLLFAAATGRVPRIFIDNSFDRSGIYSVDWTTFDQSIFFVSAYQQARANGTIDKIPGLEQRFNELFRAKKPNSILGRIIRRIRK